MKTLEQIGLLILFIIFFTHCEKTEEKEKRNNFILAGQKDNTMLTKDFEPDLEIALTNNVVNGIPTTGYSGELLLDSDLNGINDLKFYSFYGIGHTLPNSGLPSEGCQISILSTDKKIEILMNSKQLNEIIDNSRIWTNVSSLPIYLSSYDPDICYTSWKEEGLFLGYRIIQLKDTAYGWVNMQIVDNYKLKIKEIGIQR